MSLNRKWSLGEAFLLPRVAGPGVQAVIKLVQLVLERNSILTLFAFSSENWEPASEVKALMSLLKTTLRNEISKLDKIKLMVCR